MAEWVKQHVPCPCGESSDAYCVNSDGWGTCFSCDKRFPPAKEGEDDVENDGQGDAQPGGSRRPAPVRGVRMAGLLAVGEFRALVSRRIKEETCRKYGYSVGEMNGKTVQIAPYHNAAGKLVAQKVRFPNKDFVILGDMAQATLFGQKVCPSGGKRVVVTEGEIDCLAYAQAMNLSWQTVSIPTGAAGAVKAIKKNIEWLETFNEVVFLFDMDDAGEKAAVACAEVLRPGLAKIGKMPLKDAGEMVEEGRIKELCKAVWDAETERPDGLVTLADLKDKVLAPVEQGIPWPWPKLTELTYGRRTGEIYALGAGTGIGKTDVFTTIMAQTVVELGLPVGVFALEQQPEETGKRIAGKVAGKLFHVPDGSWTQEQLVAAWDKLSAAAPVHLYDHFGTADWEVIRSRIRHLVIGEGVKHIFLDHLTALAAAQPDERKALEEIMADMGGLVKELDFALYFISHLATPDGKPHEEGGRVTIRHFKGSRAIGFWSHYMFGLERDQQAGDTNERGTTTFRVLKDRYTGRSTGATFPLRYDQKTGRLHEATVADDFEENEDALEDPDF